MPHIRRIRVNNVKYNGGKQFYDDFNMNFHCKNTLYDLANGGGKSVLMLLLLQNLIPNCSLDEKQPVEKLFRTNDGSNVIHSLVEWELDKTEDNLVTYNYMTTGFCARKGKGNDVSEDENQSSEIQYFNYCIFYKNENDNDIRNLPLVKGNERITYKGLRDYLKNLQEKNTSLRVKLFDKKSDYQRFIAGYGLYESQWNIIKGINKTEGHVRTYFENNYKTTRKVVEDLLIEEIIGNAYKLKTKEKNESERLANTLLEIKEKIVELSGKKAKIENYDVQIERLGEFSSNAALLAKVYEEENKAKDETASLYRTVLEQAEKSQNEKKILENSLDNNKKEQRDAEYKKANYELYSLIKTNEENKLLVESQTLKQNAVEESIELQKKSLLHREAANYYINYAKNRKEYDTIREELINMQSDSSDILKKIRVLVYNKKHHNDINIHVLNDSLRVLNTSKTELGESIKALREEKMKAELSINTAKERYTEFAKALEEEQDKLNRLRKDIPFVVIDEDLLDNQKKHKIELEDKHKRIMTEKEEAHKAIHDMEIQIVNISNDRNNLIKRREELERTISEYEVIKSRVDAIRKVHSTDRYEELLRVLDDKKEETLLNIIDNTRKTADLKKYREQLQMGVVLEVSKETEDLLDYFRKKYKGGMLGINLLKNISREEKEDILERIPFLPYAIILEDTFYAKISEDEKPYQWQQGNTIIPIIKRSLIDSNEKLDNSNVMFAGKDTKYFTDEANLISLKNETEESIDRLEKERSILEENRKVYNENYDLVRDFLKNHESNIDSIREELQSAISGENELSIRYTEQMNRKDEIMQSLDGLDERIAGSLDMIEDTKKIIDSLIMYLDAANRYEEYANKAVNQKNIIAENEPIKAIKDTSLMAEESKLEEVNERLAFTKDSMQLLNEKWSDYEMYYDGNEYELLEISDDELDVKLEGAVKAYAKENSDKASKEEMCRKCKDNMDFAKKEIARRKQDISILEQEDAATPFTETKEDDLEALRSVIAELEKELAEIKLELDKFKNIFNNVNGRIEFSKEQIMKTYGKIIPQAELDENKGGFDIIISQLEAVMGELKRNEIIINDKINKNIANYSDIQRIRYELEPIIRENKIDIAKVQIMSIEGSIKDEQARCKLLLETATRNKIRRIRVFNDAKEQCMERLIKADAIDIAEQIKNSITVPSTIGDVEDLVQRLEDTCHMIRVERDRIESGLAEIEKIKESFENQCLQRCSNVKTELDRFPKLSSIMIDDRLTQIVKLKIPYHKEDQQAFYISKYIEDIISRIDKYETEEEKKKYIIGELALKRLFSSIVVDMNQISLELYKRERIKEQSRHLKYEEAVGSTGQSQGIYIQFLIAVINYISSINSYGDGKEGLKKVIFIDNPFGAAKDTYIWEPIFTMLADNNVQLVVPTRGATPAITGKFDVNYVLSQKLINNKLQTVVADYRSEVDKDQVEYRRAEYIQETLF